MDNKENVITSTEKKFNLKQYKGDIIYIAFLIMCLIMFPFGVLEYIWGRMNFMIHFLIITSFPIWLLMLILFFRDIFRFLRKNTREKKILIFIEICLLSMFFIPLFILFGVIRNLYDSSHPFLCGYRDRIRSRLDIEETRNWMKTYSENYTTENNQLENGVIPHNKLPECLKPIRSGGMFMFDIDRNGSPVVTQLCGASMTRWSLTIGMEDMPFPDSKRYEEHGFFWLPVAPGIYVEMD